MSVSDLWKNQYLDQIKRTTALRERLCDEQIRVQRLESQRRTMLSLLTLAANDLAGKNMPFGTTLKLMVTELRECYVEEFVLPAGRDPHHQASEPGSAPPLLPMPQMSASAVRIAPVHTEVGPTTRAPF